MMHSQPLLESLKKFRKLTLLLVLYCGIGQLNAQDYVAPELEFAFELRATVNSAMELGETPHGKRVIVPIKGGTFDGPRLKGIILPGGADYQYITMEGQRTELEAIYTIKTDDNVLIHVRNMGLLYNPKVNTKNRVSHEEKAYFLTAPKFEAPTDSNYDWLNNAIFVCKPEGKKDYISLQVWKVL